MVVFYHIGTVLGTYYLGTYYLVFQRKKITSDLVGRLISLGLTPVEEDNVSCMSIRLYSEDVDCWLELTSDSPRK